MPRFLFFTSLIFCFVFHFTTMASHLVGGTATYRYVKDTVIFGQKHQAYEVTFCTYADCFNGPATAITADNPMIMAIFNGAGAFILSDSIFYTSSILIPMSYDSSCISVPPSVCILNRTFTRTYYLLPSSTGNIIATQRCCRASVLTDMINPATIGYTLYTKIPAVGVTDSNSAPVFTAIDSRLLCINTPFTLNCTATDADGDSLSYYLASALTYVPPTSTGSFPAVPDPLPYDFVSYQSPFSGQYPMESDPAIHINSITGILSGTPIELGYYLVNIGCVEWRNHVALDTVHNEFNLIVSNHAGEVHNGGGNAAHEIWITPNPSYNQFNLTATSPGNERITAVVTDVSAER